MELVTGKLDQPLGVRVSDSCITHSMFANDTFVCAESKTALKQLVKTFCKELSKAGMSLNPAKCRTLAIVINGKTKSWFCSPQPHLNIDGALVPGMTVEETYRYLGLQVGTDYVSHKSVPAELESKLTKLLGSALNPQQKMHGLRTVVVPGLYHELSLEVWRETFLRSIDRQIRAFARRAVHLPKDTPVGFFHTATGLEGLGIPSIHTQTLFLRQKRLESLRASEDPVIRELLNASLIKGEMAKVNEKTTQIRERCAENTYSTAKKMYMAETLYESVDRRGLQHVLQSPSTNNWVRDRESRFTGKEYVSAIKVRGNLLASYERPARGRKTDNKCRLYHVMGTLDHLLQVCPRVHGLRIQRHNEICQSLGKALQKLGWNVFYEPHMKSGTSFVKPDLVCLSKEECRMVIIDPIVAVDNANLNDVAEGKVTKYSTPCQNYMHKAMAGNLSPSTRLRSNQTS